jgi:CheY-like chemotaxis protein
MSDAIGSGDKVILLVEDNPDDVLLIRRAFKKANLINPLRVASDGEQAIAYLSGKGEYADRATYPLPVFVLLDLKLPRVDGHEVIEWMRAQPGLRCIPVVVLTSSVQDADVRHAYHAGANSYLVKPVEFEALLSMVKALNLYWSVMNVPPNPNDC